jgi:hypothetical protein
MTPFMEGNMKKTERINDMLIFLNNKRYFNALSERSLLPGACERR